MAEHAAIKRLAGAGWHLEHGPAPSSGNSVVGLGDALLLVSQALRGSLRRSGRRRRAARLAVMEPRGGRTVILGIGGEDMTVALMILGTLAVLAYTTARPGSYSRYRRRTFAAPRPR